MCAAPFICRQNFPYEHMLWLCANGKYSIQIVFIQSLPLFCIYMFCLHIINFGSTFERKTNPEHKPYCGIVKRINVNRIHLNNMVGLRVALNIYWILLVCCVIAHSVTEFVVYFTHKIAFYMKIDWTLSRTHVQLEYAHDTPVWNAITASMNKLEWV